MQLHVIVEFPALPPLHYRAEEFAAKTFLSDMARWSRAVVRLDQAVTAGMRLLPNHRLFEK